MQHRCAHFLAPKEPGAHELFTVAPSLSAPHVSSFAHFWQFLSGSLPHFVTQVLGEWHLLAGGETGDDAGDRLGSGGEGLGGGENGSGGLGGNPGEGLGGGDFGGFPGEGLGAGGDGLGGGMIGSGLGDGSGSGLGLGDAWWR